MTQTLKARRGAASLVDDGVAPVAHDSSMRAVEKAPELLFLPVEQLHESSLNSRHRFHDATLQELAQSIREHGILTPLLARPTSNGTAPAFELAAGHRRLRSAKLAGLTLLPVLVREMTDAQFVEVLTIDNLQRENVHPLEEAQGFADLMKYAGYDVARIAERIGKSPRYVYDRMRMLQLTPAVQELFFNEEITAGHAVLLARLTPEQQARAVEETNALFTIDHGADRNGDGEFELDDRRKAMSVGELQHWIDQHVRFNVTAEDVPELFPETAALVAPAIEQAEKVISITWNHYVNPEAKPEDGERTYGPQSWTRADGEDGSKVCDRSVIGVIVVGPGRGESFRVCTDKKKCTVHYGKEIRAAAKRAKERESGDSPSSAPAADRHAKERAKQDAAREKDEAARVAFKAVLPEIYEAVAAQVKKLPAGTKGAVGQQLIRTAKRYAIHGAAPDLVKPGTTSTDLVRYLVFLAIASEARSYNAYSSFAQFAKGFGVDVAKILKAKAAAKETKR